MRAFLGASLLLVSAMLLIGSGVNAQADKKDDKKVDTKEVTLKGTITCLKCGLKQADKCATVIVVKTDEKDSTKDVVYLLDQAGHKKYHGDVCSKAKAGSVTGIVSEADGKKIITVKELKYDEKKE